MSAFGALYATEAPKVFRFALRRRTWLLAGSLVVGSGALLADQRGDVVHPLTSEGSISGTVRDEQGNPLAGVAVVFHERGWVGHTHVFTQGPGFHYTDAEGRYRIAGLFPSEVIVSVPVLATTTARSVLDAYGRTPPGRDGPGRRIYDVMEETRVIPLLYEIGLDLGAHLLTVTHGTAPGRVDPPATTGGLPRTWRTTFHPGATRMDDARIVTIGEDTHLTGIDIGMATARAGTITGRLDGPDDAEAFMPVHVIPIGASSRHEDNDAEVAVTLADEHGDFTLFGVPAGDYLLRSSFGSIVPGEPPPPGSATGLRWWAEARVTVEANDVELGSLPLQPPLSIRAQIVAADVVDSLPAAGASTSMTVRARRRGALTPSRPAAPLAGSRVVMTGLQPGDYILETSSRDWMVRSITVGGTDVTDTFVTLEDGDLSNVVITVTHRLTRARGVVRDDSGLQVPNARVVLFPADHGRWAARGASPHFVRSIRADAEGRYDIGGVPAGNYRIAAYPDGSLAEWPEPRLVARAAAQSVGVALGEGETLLLNLVVSK